MKTFKMPPHQRKAWDEDPIPGYQIKTVPLSEVEKRDNLGSYHQDVWGTDPEDYRMDVDMASEWGPWEWMRARRGQNGKYRMADGNHRIRALQNSGYDSVEMPVLDDEYSTAMGLFGRKPQ